jgi:hypothetical protein
MCRVFIIVKTQTSMQIYRIHSLIEFYMYILVSYLNILCWTLTRWPCFPTPTPNLKKNKLSSKEPLRGVICTFQTKSALLFNMVFFSLFMPLKGQHLGLTSHQKETALKEIGVRIQNLLTVQDSIVNTHTRTHTNKS